MNQGPELTERTALAEPLLPGLPANLPGFDPFEVRIRFGDMPELFSEVSSEFLKDYGSVDGTLRQLVEAGQTGEARWVAHALKGVAGNIGAKALSEAAQALLVALHRAETETETETVPLGRLVEAIAVELVPVVASCRAVETGAELSGSAGESLVSESSAAVGRVCVELAALIRSRNLRAVEVSVVLAEALAETTLGDRARQVAAALNRFDFKAAVAALDLLVRRRD
ncbi:hypothetical protein WCLP8_3560013 [uncultured Gammaproteobacteria bacterium]